MSGKSGGNRKHGRNARHSVAQKTRTARNKARKIAQAPKKGVGHTCPPHPMKARPRERVVFSGEVRPAQPAERGPLLWIIRDGITLSVEQYESRARGCVQDSGFRSAAETRIFRVTPWGASRELPRR